MAANLVKDDNDPQLLFDGRVMLTATSKKPKKHIEDIISWIEAFSIYTWILSSYFPQLWGDRV